VIGGGQIGYNWHRGPTWVIGVEADIQGSGQSDSTTCITLCRPDAPALTRISQDLSWFGTVRGRLGWANGAALYYVTGGWAFGHVKTDTAFQFNAGAPALDARSFSDNLSGWTVGGGIETRIAQKWTAKAEYLYMDLGTTAASFVYASLATFRFATASEIHNHVFRAGVNYRFDGWPIIASY
jgi:outer membrane immunogenic protein